MLQTLKSKKSHLSIFLCDALNRLPLRNIFNPSFRIFSEKYYICFRADNGRRPFDAYLLIFDDINNKLINLTDMFSSVERTIADPKLLELNNELWVTFNTGWQKGTNELYLCQLTPSIKNPQICRYKERQDIEKNWAFFTLNEQIYALYSLNNPKILTLTSMPTDGDLLFVESNKKITQNQDCSHLTIGTQMIFYEDAYHLISHRKFNIGRKRIYLGRLISIKIRDFGITISTSKNYIFHSFNSLLGNNLKHNKNLLSCSYFSGLYRIDNSLIISYGINDVDFNFSEISIKNL